MTENAEKSGLSIGEIATNYILVLAQEEKDDAQAEVFKFVRWFGWERSISELSPAEVGNYADRLSTSDNEYVKKLDLVKSFLIYAKNQGYTNANLSIHLKPKKGGKPKTGGKTTSLQPESVPLTQEGYEKLKAELEELKRRRPLIIEEITKAAADKDFRENAPLEAAREQHGLIEGRIREIEAILKAAEIVDNHAKTALKVHMGDTVVLVEMETGEEMCYQIVGPREANPSKGKISGVSPVGKAVIGKEEGEIVEVTAPIGKITYQIKQIKR